MKLKKFVLMLILIISMATINGCAAFGMRNLPEGELMDTVYSPDEKYAVNAYLVSGGATVDFSVRCEVVELESGDKRNIYWNYHCNNANIRWIDNTIVEINGKELNVKTDSYDWRDD